MKLLLLRTEAIGSSLFRVAVALVSCVLAGPSMGQTGQSGSQTPTGLPGPQTQEPNQSEDDPTRIVFFSVREEYRNLRNGAWNNRLILRKDTAIMKGSRFARPRGLLLRFDVPVTATHLGQGTRTGLGDLYGQVLYIPYLSRNFAFAAGTGIFLPSATHKTLGTGKWQVAPLAVPVWYLPRRRGFFLVKFQHLKSLAGPSDRPDFNSLLITPAFFYRPNKLWWIQADAESNTDWERGKHTDFRVGFQVGKVITPRFALAVKPEIPLGGRRVGDWTLKVTTTWYR